MDQRLWVKGGFPTGYFSVAPDLQKSVQENLLMEHIELYHLEINGQMNYYHSKVDVSNFSYL